MKYRHILVTGGAGFIGSHLTDALVDRGYQVRIFDSLENQVHQGKKPSYLNRAAEFIEGDIRNVADLRRALAGIDAVFHEAAAVGVGQSQYEIKRYIDVNVGGTANLLDILVNKKTAIKKIIVTTSMTSYGEGNYRCESCGVVRPGIRSEKQMQSKDWELHCPICQRYTTPIATDEQAATYSSSIYALTKKMQEDIVLSIGKTYGIPAVALRCFNVYGPRQSLSNPYTGVTAIFISRLKNRQPPIIFEDGLQSRDFVSVYDVVRANILALEKDEVNYTPLNIGSGIPRAVKDVATVLARLLKKDTSLIIGGEFRKNDLRHCFADITRAKILLGWNPKISFTSGMEDLIQWAEQETAVDKTLFAIKLLKKKGLTS